MLPVSTRSGDPLLDEIERIAPPVVAAGAVRGREKTIPCTAAGDREGARQITRYLVERGRRKIATITGPPDTPDGPRRSEGFTDVPGRRAAKKLIEHGGCTRRGGEQAMIRPLARSPDLDAVFVGSDLRAAGAPAALRAAGRRVPEDVAVAGFDGSAVAPTTHPPLTTVRQPPARVAEETVRPPLEPIDGATTVEPVILPTELVIRESACGADGTPAVPGVPSAGLRRRTRGSRSRPRCRPGGCAWRPRPRRCPRWC